MAVETADSIGSLLNDARLHTVPQEELMERVDTKCDRVLERVLAINAINSKGNENTAFFGVSASTLERLTQGSEFLGRYLAQTTLSAGSRSVRDGHFIFVNWPGARKGYITVALITRFKTDNGDFEYTGIGFEGVGNRVNLFLPHMTPSINSNRFEDRARDILLLTEAAARETMRVNRADA